MSDQLPRWHRVLAVVAHPDDESFGLGGLLSGFTDEVDATVSVLCFTRGEASTLGEGDLRRQRAAELAEAARRLGVGSVTLLDYPDGRLSGVPLEELVGEVVARARGVDGIVAFGRGGITGHPDHVRATEAAIAAAERLGLPVLGWVIPSGVAEQLNSEFGTAFVGERAPDLRVLVDRGRQRHAALAHHGQLSPVLWRRYELSGEEEWLVWLRPGRG